MLGLFSVAQSFGLLLIGMEILSDPSAQQHFGLFDRSHLQSLMFLQLVAGGHLLLFVTRSEQVVLPAAVSRPAALPRHRRHPGPGRR